MPFFTTRRGYRSGWGDDSSSCEHRYHDCSHEQSALQHQTPVLVQSSQPVRIARPSSVAQPSPTSPTSSTSLLGDYATCPIPSYETVQRGIIHVSKASPENTLQPPRYNPRWARLPGYRDATAGVPLLTGTSLQINLGATPPNYWGGMVDSTMFPIGTGGQGMFFNSPFRHYPVHQRADLERAGERSDGDEICGMSARRADVVINLSLLALCILIWSAVILSLNFSEPRQPAGSTLAETSDGLTSPFDSRLYTR